MSQENVEIARSVLAALGDRDAARLISLAHPDVEWHSFFALGEGGRPYQGYEGTGQYMRDLSDAFDVGYAEVEEALGVGDVVLLVGHIHYRGKGSGAEGKTPTGWVLKFRDRKVVCFRAFRNPEQALEAVGLSE